MYYDVESRMQKRMRKIKYTDSRMGWVDDQKRRPIRPVGGADGGGENVSDRSGWTIHKKDEGKD